jgi:hypothetical protein
MDVLCKQGVTSSSLVSSTPRYHQVIPEGAEPCQGCSARSWLFPGALDSRPALRLRRPNQQVRRSDREACHSLQASDHCRRDSDHATGRVPVPCLIGGRSAINTRSFASRPPIFLSANRLISQRSLWRQASVIIVQANNVILTEVVTVLDLDEHEGNIAGVLNPVSSPNRDIDGISAPHTDAVAVKGDHSLSADHKPMLGTA